MHLSSTAAHRQIAAAIPQARYVSLPGTNHLMLEKEPAWGDVSRGARPVPEWVVESECSSAATVQRIDPSPLCKG
jgi:hypothetical protein